MKVKFIINILEIFYLGKVEELLLLLTLGLGLILTPEKNILRNQMKKLIHMFQTFVSKLWSMDIVNIVEVNVRITLEKISVIQILKTTT